MPRSLVLSALERQSLLAMPDNKDEMIRQYTFNETDLSIIRQRRGQANRLGFAIHLCYMRYPGIVMGIEDKPFEPLLQMVATQLKVPVEAWMEYGRRLETRREHLIELQTIFGFRSFTMEIYRSGVRSLDDLAWRTDKGIVLALALVE
jgi:TnpA family transposase